MNKRAKIYIAGHRGLVGSAILKNLQEKGTLILLPKPIKNLIYQIKKPLPNFLKRKNQNMYF